MQNTPQPTPTSQPALMMRPSGESRRKSVTFATRASMRHTLHLNDYSSEEWQACYYGEVEYHDINEEIKCTIDMMSQNMDIDEVRYSRRGLVSAEAKRLRYQRRRASKFAVFSEQMNHSPEIELYGPQERLTEPTGTAAMESMATAYSAVVHESVALSHRIGLLDEQVVRSQIKLEKEETQVSKPSLFKRSDILSKFRKRTRARISSVA